MSKTLQMEVALECVTCYKCGIPFAFPAHLMTQFRRNHEEFYCPHGHSQYFPGKSDIEKARDEAARLAKLAEYHEARADRHMQNAEHLERSRNAYKGKVTQMKNRVANGVCPCCNRYFANLHKHMQNQHPEFASEPNEPAAGGGE